MWTGWMGSAKSGPKQEALEFLPRLNLWKVLVRSDDERVGI